MITPYYQEQTKLLFSIRPKEPWSKWLFWILHSKRMTQSATQVVFQSNIMKQTKMTWEEHCFSQRPLVSRFQIYFNFQIKGMSYTDILSNFRIYQDKQNPSVSALYPLQRFLQFCVVSVCPGQIGGWKHFFLKYNKNFQVILFSTYPFIM